MKNKQNELIKLIKDNEILRIELEKLKTLLEDKNLIQNNLNQL